MNAQEKQSQKIQEKIDAYHAKIKQYDKEKVEIKSTAEGFEKSRDLNKQHSNIFGIAVIFLQVSILLSSIAALIKRKYIWIVSMGIGLVGLFYFMDGFFLFFN
jgi:hypothetical protein